MSKYPIEWSKAKKQRAWALAKAQTNYAALIKLLGGRCAWCGNNDIMLTIDHVDGRLVPNSKARSSRWDVRVATYIREHHDGIRLQVLCRSCNSRDGRRRQLETTREKLKGDENKSTDPT